LISAWTKHLEKPEDKERFKNEVLGSKMVLRRLQEILKEVESDLDNTELNTKVYDVPNWDYRQADINGSRRMLRTINKIINLDQQDKK
jgi:predicted phosphohydrolase